MKGLRATLAALALLAAAPALLLAAEGDPPVQPQAEQELVPIEQVNTPPTAAFEVAPDLDPAEDAASVAVGETVTLDASGSSDAEAALARFEWDLDGDGVYESDAGAGAALQHAFQAPGELDLALRVTDAAGETAEAEKRLTVEAPLEAPPAEEEVAAPAEPPTAAKAAPQPKAEPSKPRRAKAAQDEPKEPAARDAASSGVTIKDFSFAPKSVTVNVGDTVTWTNNGDEVHTATANDGSFDTGNLSTGDSGSHTFSKAGTFAYICKPHPFMKGTVTVAGAGGGGSSGGDAGAAGTDDSGAAGESGGGSSSGLARTGSDLFPLIGLGLLMLLLGAGVQRRVPG